MSALDWLDRHPPAAVIAALEPLLTDERRARIEAVLALRLANLTVAIENLHDPHNGAAALRSVEGFGLGELHVVESVEKFSFSSRVTQGCDKWVTIQRYPIFADCAAALHARGFRLAAAVPGGDVALEELDVSIPTALIFGNEHAGLTGDAQKLCDVTFGIPMQGFTQSFNLSVSVALSVHDCSRRRRALALPEALDDATRLRTRARWMAQSLDARAAEAIVDRHVSNGTRANVGEEPR